VRHDTMVEDTSGRNNGRSEHRCIHLDNSAIRVQYHKDELALHHAMRPSPATTSLEVAGGCWMRAYVHRAED